MSKTVLVIGLSGAGTAVVQALLKDLPESHRVVAVNSTDFAYWPISALRASVVPGWEDKTVAPLSGLVAPGGRHLVLGGSKVVRLDLDRKVAMLDAPRPELNGSADISYDYVVVATGSDYGLPMRPPAGVKSMHDAKAFLKTLQSQFASAQNILIAGAGPVGIEVAGEIASHFGKGKKNITVVTSADKLFPGAGWKDGFRNTIKKSLESQDIKLITNARVDISGHETGPLPAGTEVSVRHNSGEVESVKADFLFLAVGIKPNTGLFPDSVLAESRRLVTNEHLGIPGYPGAYAVGDAIDRDAKMVAATGPQAGTVVKNLLASINGKPEAAVHKDFPQVMLVPVGPTGGGAQMFGMTVGGFMASQIKGKTLFTPKFIATYPEKYVAPKKGWF